MVRWPKGWVWWTGFWTVGGPVWAAGTWRVTPIRVELDARTRSAVVTVINEGDEPLHLQMKAFEWTQDGAGNDQYRETDDLIFYPKLMEVGPNDSRILRVGLKAPAVARERTYRLFLEEIPAPRKPREERGAEVAIAIRFGLPVFVKPVKEEPKGVLESVSLSHGRLSVVIRNAGNTHFVIESIAVRGQDAGGQVVYTQDLNGWYLLGGASRTYTVQVPQDVCPRLRRLNLRVKTDRFEMEGGLDVQAAMCRASAEPASAPTPDSMPSSKPPGSLPKRSPEAESGEPSAPSPAPPASVQEAPPTVLSLIQARRLDEAVRVSLERLRQMPSGWLLQVELACQVKTVLEDAPRLRPPERVYLLPRTLGGRACYVLAYGVFPTPAEARQAFERSVGVAALDLASPPVPVSTADVWERVGRGRAPYLSER